MYDIAVLGGGIIGLSTAYECLLRFPDKRILVLEKENSLALHQTGKNSGVIHSGIYYKPGSMKAINCRIGINKLIQFCDRYQIPYELCGKLIVATTDDEIPALNDLYKRGLDNGISDLEIIKHEQIKEVEPHVFGIKGILSPSTGIVDYREVCLKCAEYIRDNDGEIKLSTKVLNIVQQSKENIIVTNRGDYKSKIVINCAGLFSDRIARLTQNKTNIQIIPFRGEYYKLRDEKKYLVKNLVYPVPDPKFPFLGVHFTRRIDGSIEAGPNAVLAFAREGYRKYDINLGDLSEILTNPAFWKLGKKYWKVGTSEMLRSFFKSLFVKSLKKLVPKINKQDIIAGGSGIRAQALLNNGKLLDDFKVLRNENIIHVLNAPSPAATGSFAIAENIVRYIDS